MHTTMDSSLVSEVNGLLGDLDDAAGGAGGRLKEANRLDEISLGIHDVYLWVLCALGVPGNVLTIVSILTMGKLTPATFLVALLASYDGVALVTKLVGLNLIQHEVPTSDFLCKLQFVPIFLSAMANWTLALIALERFFSVCYPLQKAYLFTKKRTYAIAVLNAVVLFIFYASFFAVFRVAHDNKLECGVKKYNSNFWKYSWNYINPTIVLFVPFLVSVVLTSLIIYGLTKSRKARRSMIQHSQTSSGSGNKHNIAQDNNRKLIKETERADRMITIMLILASVLFVVLSMPACVYYIAFRESSDALIKARWSLFKQVSFVMLDSSHAINFFLYFVSAKRFRNHFISLLSGKHFRKRRDHTGASSMSNPTESSKFSTAM